MYLKERLVRAILMDGDTDLGRLDPVTGVRIKPICVHVDGDVTRLNTVQRPGDNLYLTTIHVAKVDPRGPHY